MTGAVARALALLSRSGGWIDHAGPDGAYPVRLGPDRRSRAVLRLDETGFRALIESPGLRPRPGGGWTTRPLAARVAQAAPGTPGRIEGERWLMADEGTPVPRRANLGESPLAWLARRTDPDGRPWLSPAEIAAGERLRLDAELALRGQSITMRWDALPRASGGSATRIEPGDRALAASRRVAGALGACDPASRAFVDQICIRSQTLQLAEQACGLRRRHGKVMLKRGLAALARHYRIG